MRITIVGSGYVGLVAGACFAQVGNQVTCLDIDKAKIEKLKRGEVPIYEPGLEALILEGVKQGHLSFTDSKEAALGLAEVIFIAVGTPMGEDGSADLSFVRLVARDLGDHICSNQVLVVTKSTVPVGTTRSLEALISDGLRRRGFEVLDFDDAADLDSRESKTIRLGLVSNPEFLKEGMAIKDFLSPDRVVVGTKSAGALAVMKALYAPFLLKSDRLIAMGLESAEMTKYASNALLATKISFINEISQICERIGANVNEVRQGLGADSRIGYSFIYPGCGYGGSCFPKDVRALEKSAKECGYDARILSAIQRVNEDQKLVLVKKILKRFGDRLDGLSFAVWGLSFKPETDDMREASALVIVRELVSRGARVKAYDPRACGQARFYFEDILHSVTLEESKYEALKGCEALIVITEWREFRSPDFDEIARLLKKPLIFDGRNIYQNLGLKDKGFELYQIGVGTPL